MRIGAVLATLLSLGCSEAPRGAGARCATVDDSGQFSITDQSNYTFVSDISIDRTTLQDATDLVFDWSGISTDFFGKALDPSEDIDLVLISLWNMTPEELRQNVERDNLPLNVNKGAITTYPDGSFTSQNLLSFDSFGNELPEEDLWSRFDTQHPMFQYPQDSHTFMIMASSGTAVGKGARMLGFFGLDPASNNTELELTDASTTLDYSVNLRDAAPVRVPQGVAELNIDWGEMTVNALGNEYVPTQITRAVVAHYPGHTLRELEMQFLELEELAGGWWSGEVLQGTSIDLDSLVDESGASFPGVDGDGVWLVALFCTANCSNPAPWSITVLEPCDG
jgi:hypothetical protein